MGADEVTEDDLLTFEGWLKFQGAEAATAEELRVLRGCFNEVMHLRQSSPKVGLMKLRSISGEQKYAVAIRDGSDLWLTMWVRCTARHGETVILYPRANAGEPHATYHRDGRFHQKSYGKVSVLKFQRQPLTANFKGTEHLGAYSGHGISSGAICDPTVFDEVMIVEPGILNPIGGSVVVDLVEPGYEPKPDPSVHARQVFPRGDRPSVVITICRGDKAAPVLTWPDDFIKIS